ncbi:DUF763 domain-containing protein [Metallosphaera tengchongensis]|uniref:DUF763 domain-containing protein n=1 Tax=Metallosphaera tengchongensis TaxID=1532350 RepID=A0A6N0NVL9_9CREN|nr:DUF763 domain-containing protein [Metallosphaera tengchongensis]QKQ99199.1 DUF763 domain-containing protein [Metallosphaera tengchongensis]
MEITGVSDLPLHYGRVPNWLIPIMRRLSRAIMDVMLLEWGPGKVVERLSNPLWFQGFNNVIGMDWDSSGSTTVTLGILKEVTRPQDDGLAILGGKGRNSLNVPLELRKLPGRFDVDVEKLERTSRLVAKVDSTLLQDGYELYHHSLILDEKGRWGVIQQGMNLETKFARRYHWISVANPVDELREGIAGAYNGVVLNVHESHEAKEVIIDLLGEDPRRISRQYLQLMSYIRGNSIESWLGLGTLGAISREARMIYMKPVDVNKVMKILNHVREFSPTNLQDALLLGLGPSTVRALSLISDLIYSEPPSYRDPVNYPYDPFKYAFAIGGKDGVPYPVRRDVAFEVIQTLEDIVSQTKLDKKDKSLALNKLRELKLGTSKRS